MRPDTVPHAKLCNPATPESPDVLCDVFQNAQFQGWIVRESSFTAPWGVSDNRGMARFYHVVQGSCWLEIEGAESALCLGPGDLVFTMQGKAHSLYDGWHSTTAPLKDILPQNRMPVREGIVFGGGGEATKIVCGGFSCDGHLIGLLLSSLPLFLCVKGVNKATAPWLADILRLVLRESEEYQPGRQLIVNHLIQIIFVEAVRAHLEKFPDRQGDWLTAMTDPDIGLALRLMHGQPERHWTVASLADKAGMSRSAFASRFKLLMQLPPQRYLLEYRMRKACSMLAEGRYGIKEIAGQVGYSTGAAFSNAFKRWSGQAPRAHRRVALGKPLPQIS